MVSKFLVDGLNTPVHGLLLHPRNNFLIIVKVLSFSPRNMVYVRENSRPGPVDGTNVRTRRSTRSDQGHVSGRGR